MIRTFLLILILSLNSLAQGVSINKGGAEPESGSILDVSSSTYGVLLPRLKNYNNLHYDLNTSKYFYNTTPFTYWGESDNNIAFPSIMILTTGLASQGNGLEIEGGILNTGTPSSKTLSGTLFYDASSNDGEYKFIDKDGIEQLLGANNYSRTFYDLPTSNLSFTFTNGDSTTQQVFLPNPPRIESITVLNVQTQNSSTYNKNMLVYGRLGIGFDVFGFDDGFKEEADIFLKENNLRIRFEDTSNISENYPSLDWEIEANSNQNGGDSYFAIKNFTDTIYTFRVDAGTEGTNVLTSNNLGIGTLLPRKMLSISDNTNPVLRLSEASGTATLQSWDLDFDNSKFNLSDETNSLSPLQIEAEAPDNSISISEKGVGFGVSNPERSLHVNGILQIEPTDSAPDNPSKGDLYFDSNDNKLKCYDGSSWKDLW